MHKFAILKYCLNTNLVSVREAEVKKDHNFALFKYKSCVGSRRKRIRRLYQIACLNTNLVSVRVCVNVSREIIEQRLNTNLVSVRGLTAVSVLSVSTEFKYKSCVGSSKSSCLVFESIC